MKERPILIQGGQYTDVRGTVSFVNDFRFEEVKRFYVIEHPDTAIIRAWHGHQIERKWFYIVVGEFKVVIIKPDNWESPRNYLQIYEFELNVSQAQILLVPGGFVNGFKAIVPNSKVIVYSNLSIEESANDDFRFDSALWFDWATNKVRK